MKKCIHQLLTYLLRVDLRCGDVNSLDVAPVVLVDVLVGDSPVLLHSESSYRILDSNGRCPLRQQLGLGAAFSFFGHIDSSAWFRSG